MLLTIEPPIIVMVPAVGARVLLAFTVKAPETEKDDVGWAEGVSEIVRPLKTNVLELVIPQPVVAIVIVPPDGEKLAEEAPTARVPLTEKLELVVTVAPAATVRLLKVSVPPELEIEEPLFMVMVPEEGVKVPVTVKTPLTVALLAPVEMEPETVRGP